jgi:hypothetical protein
MHIQLGATLDQMSHREGDFAQFNNNIVTAIKAVREKFKEYKELMEGNDISTLQQF